MTKVVSASELANVLIYPTDNSGRLSMLPPDATNGLNAFLTKKKVFPAYLNIRSINYYNNKRGFVVMLSDRSRHFVRPKILKDLNLIYLGRRLLGQPHCCAKAHAMGQNLPGSYKNHEKFKTFESVNLIPCNKCFDKSEHEYLMEVRAQQHPLMSGVQTENVNMVFAIALLYLIQGDSNSYLTHEGMEEINDAFFIKSVESTVRGLQNIVAEGQRVLDTVQHVTDPIDIGVVQLIENTVTTALRMANEITNRDVDALDVNDCYELAEVMAQLRANLNNLTFALKYKGVGSGEF